MKPFAVRRLLFFDRGQRGEAAEAAGVQHADRPVQGGGGDSKWGVGRGGQVGHDTDWHSSKSNLLCLLDLRCLSFSLGCGIGYGYLHRIPTRPVLPVGSQADVGPVKDSTQDPAPTSSSQPAVDSGCHIIAIFKKGQHFLSVSDPAAYPLQMRPTCQKRRRRICQTWFLLVTLAWTPCLLTTEMTLGINAPSVSKQALEPGQQ